MQAMLTAFITTNTSNSGFAIHAKCAKNRSMGPQLIGDNLSPSSGVGSGR